MGAVTTTTPGGQDRREEGSGPIVAAHDLPYMATACAAYPQDLYAKVAKALSIPARSSSICSAPPPGWRYFAERSVEVGKLAVKTGLWVLYEREHGQLRINPVSKAR